MADRIEVGFKKGIRDALGEKTKKRIIEISPFRSKKLPQLKFIQLPEIFRKGIQQAAAGPLSDPVIQEFSINQPLAKNFDWLIEVGFSPGVTDNVGKTAREAIELLLGENIGTREIAFILPGSI